MRDILIVNYNGLVGLIVLSSVLLAIAQYFDVSHKDIIEKIKAPLEGTKFPKNKGMEKIKTLWEEIQNTQILRLRNRIVGVYIALLALSGVYCGITITNNSNCLYWSLVIISSYIFILYALVGYALWAMRKQKSELTKKANEFNEKYKLVSQTMESMESEDCEDDIPF